ncbi:MAG TPA: HAD-IA family hydrolase [Vicinamibacterales bacterium]|nr:HAD-IA family hydrolase [Vicinamibacterales bacterium]
MTRAVFFDVDFTLIHPGPTFLGAGYRTFCARYGIEVDPAKFEQAVIAAAPCLDTDDDRYTDELFVVYTRRIVEGMGGTGPNLDSCAREIYREWAACQHFELYDEVPDVLRELFSAGLRIGLISNSHRCLASFQSHFDLQGLVSATISSSEHGFMKPHPSIFAAALQLVNVAPAEAAMVGDSLRHDVEGAMRAGMQGILLHRGETCPARAATLGVPVIRSLRDLPRLLSLA